MWRRRQERCKRLQGVEFSELFLESASREGEGGVADGAAPEALDGVGGAAGAGEEEGEGVAEVVELVEVVGAVGLAIEEGDGLEEDEDDVGCVGAGPGEGVLGPLAEEVGVGAGDVELATLDGEGCEFAGADGVAVVEEEVIAPTHVEAVVVVVSVDEEGKWGEVDPEEGARECEGDGDRMWVPGDGVGVGAWGEAETDVECGVSCAVFEVGLPVDDSGGEGVAADGGAGLQAQLGGGPRRSVDHGGDAEAGDVLCLEKAIDEGVQEGVVVREEDADREEPGGVEDYIDNVGGGEGEPHDVRSVPVLPGIGRFAVAVAGGRPAGIPMADTGVGEARTAPGEKGEEGLLFRRGLCDRDEEHVACVMACGRVYEGCEGDERVS